MSAFVVSHTHINQLVEAYARYVVPGSDRQVVGEVLLEANLRSVHYLYREAHDPADLQGYTYAAPEYVMTPLEAFSAVQHYAYQACEFPEYADSDAGQAMQCLEDALLPVLGVLDAADVRKLPGYADVLRGIYESGRPAPAPVDTRPVRYIPITEVAKLLRQALKATFPGVKFAVRSDKYAGGSSIRVSWVDGPTYQTVEPLLKAFEGASFDGMIDLKTYHTSELAGERVRFGNDYVFGSRSHSLDFVTKAAQQVTARLGIPMPQIGVYGSSGLAYVKDNDPQRYYDEHAREFVELPVLIYREQVQMPA